MTDPLICPECDGVIGATPGSGQRPCRCFDHAPSATVRPEPSAVRLEPEPAAPPVATADDSGPAVVEKICRVCGKNVAGHRRLKDTLGYMCIPCARAEEEANSEGLVSCAECGRRLKPAGLVDYNGLRICKVCHKDHVEQAKYKAPPPNLTKHIEHQQNSIKTLLIIGGVLLLIIVLASLGVLGAR